MRQREVLWYNIFVSVAVNMDTSRRPRLDNGVAIAWISLGVLRSAADLKSFKENLVTGWNPTGAPQDLV